MILEVTKQIEFSYPGQDDYVYNIPKGMHFLSGKIYSILGINGSGKSTILTLLSALRRFSEGAIRYQFQQECSPIEIEAHSWKKKVGPPFWKNIGFSFQKPEMIRALNVKQNLELALGTEKAQTIPLNLFTEKEWQAVRHAKIWRISGGQAQRLGIIRAFGEHQNLIFMDEPTNNLDQSNRKKLVQFIQKYQGNRTLVLVSHDQLFLEMLKIHGTLRINETQEIIDTSSTLKRRTLTQ